MSKSINICYFATLQDQRGLSEETIETELKNTSELYTWLKNKHSFKQEMTNLKVAVNDEFSDWQHLLQNGDKIVFIPPVAGG